jgi:hypothetical protein
MKKIIAIIAVQFVLVVSSKIQAQTEIERLYYSIDTFMQKQHPKYAKIKRFKVLDIKSKRIYLEVKKDSAISNEAIFELGKHPSSLRVSGPFVTLKDYAESKFPNKYRDFIVPFDFEDNSTKIIKGFINDVNSPENKDFNFDLYYFTVFKKEGLKWFIMVQDYQNPTTLESIKKAMRDR